MPQLWEFLGGCSRKSSEVNFNRETEVLIVGAGGAGLAAAAQAASEGAEVLVLEKAGLVGGDNKLLRRCYAGGGYFGAERVFLL